MVSLVLQGDLSIVGHRGQFSAARSIPVLPVCVMFYSCRDVTENTYQYCQGRQEASLRFHHFHLPWRLWCEVPEVHWSDMIYSFLFIRGARQYIQSGFSARLEARYCTHCTQGGVLDSHCVRGLDSTFSLVSLPD